LATSKRRGPAEARPARRRFRRLFSNAAAVGVILSLGWGAVNTPVFRAHDIRVSGTVHLTRAQVLDQAAVEGVTNVVRLSTRVVEERLERNPWIADAHVTKELPGTVSIQIRERGPVAALRSGREWARLAGDGTVLDVRRKRPALAVIERPAPAADRRGTPAPPVVSPGMRIAFARPLLAVLAGLSDTVDVVLLRVGSDGGSELRLAAGERVRYGDGSQPDRKHQALVSLLRWVGIQGRTARTIDVRVPEAPAVTLLPAP
jgi:cell division protein FtsQ